MHLRITFINEEKQQYMMYSKQVDTLPREVAESDEQRNENWA